MMDAIFDSLSDLRMTEFSTTGVTLGDDEHAAPDATLLMRDGGRLSVQLEDPAAQAAMFARLLVERSQGRPAQTLTLKLADGSTLMLSAAEILGLQLPPEMRCAPPAALAPPAPIEAVSGDSADGNTQTFSMGRFRVMRIRNFLPEPVAEALHRYAVARESSFVPSKVCSNDPEYRKSVVLFSFPEYEHMFSNALSICAPSIVQALGLPEFDLKTIECQLTATSDGGYFKPHTDNGGKMGYRKITFVYYMHKHPKTFDGGEIKFLDYNPYGVEIPNPRQCMEFAPEHNSIILFDSGCTHQVQDVVCPAGGFRNARFTLNGWLGTEKPPQV